MKKKSLLIRACLLAMSLGLSTTTNTWAGGRARLQADMNASAIKHLFDAPLPAVQNPARHTFVFWVNGDQDHFEPQSSLATPGERAPRLYRADKFEVQHILDIGNSCQSCNIVILHDQRGSARWYTAKRPWASYLRVYSRGRFYLQRHVNEVDETDPHLLAWLLYFAQGIFPQSELHLIYRGHSFRTPYTPGSREILPFDYSNANHGYGPDVFVESLKNAALTKRLGSVTFAACSMASLEMVSKLQPYAQYFVGSEVDVLEVLDVGFRFNSLMQVTDAMDNRQVSWLLGWRLLEAFKDVPVLQDAMMEYPTTWTDLAGIPAISAKFNELASSLEALPADQHAKIRELLKRQALLTKAASDRFIDSLRRAGKPKEVIELLLNQLRMPSANPHDLELGLFLESIEKSPETEALHGLATELKNLVYGSIWVINQPSDSGGKIGLSVSWQEPPRAFLPKL